jgi:hypothetical protein
MIPCFLLLPLWVHQLDAGKDEVWNGSIVLQKSQKAQRLISRQRTKRTTIADQ